MTPESIFGAVAFAFVTSITPGPNNAMLLASGVNHGFRRTWPHMLGINVGFPLMLIAVGLGFAQIFATFPVLHHILHVVGSVYLLYLAWIIARSGGVASAGAKARPMTFLQAAAFQWINPKAWIIAVGAIAAFVPKDSFSADLPLLAAIYAVVNLPCIAVWAGLGAAMQRALTNPRRLRAFNIIMAVLLALSVALSFSPSA